MLIAIILFDFSFVYSQFNTTKFTKLTTDSCINKTEEVYLFFEGEKIDFEYKKIGFIEVKPWFSDEDFQTKFKNVAYQNCSNVVINIKKDYVYSGSSEFNSSYSVYSGLAVYVKTDSIFEKKYGNIRDTSFIRRNERFDDKFDEDFNKMIKGVFRGLLSAAIAVAAVISTIVVIIITND